jgi:hypothetical protein
VDESLELSCSMNKAVNDPQLADSEIIRRYVHEGSQ